LNSSKQWEDKKKKKFGNPRGEILEKNKREKKGGRAASLFFSSYYLRRSKKENSSPVRTHRQIPMSEKKRNPTMENPEGGRRKILIKKM